MQVQVGEIAHRLLVVHAAKCGRAREDAKNIGEGEALVEGIEGARQLRPSRQLLGGVAGGRAQLHPRTHIHRDDGSSAPLPHDVGRQIVEHAAVHEQVALVRHRRRDAGNCRARAYPAPERTPIMDDHLGAREVRRYAEVRDPEILNEHVAEHRLEQLHRTGATHECDHWHSEIARDFVADETSAADLGHRGNIVSQRVQAGHHRAHARATHHVHVEPLLCQRAQHTDLREATRAATAQRQAERCAGDGTGKPCDIASVAQSHMMMRREPGVAPSVEPSERPGRT